MTMGINLLNILNIIISITLAIGGVAAYRAGLHKTISEVQERVITALSAEINSLKDNIAMLEKENIRLGQVQEIIIASMKKKGFIISIDGLMVTIHDGNTVLATTIDKTKNS